MESREQVSVLAELRALVAFRLAQVRGPARRRLVAAVSAVPVIVAALAAVGALLPRERAGEALVLLPTVWFAFAVVSVVAGVTGASSRELLTREQGTPFPVSPAADNLGAVLMAPLNLAWMLQTALLVVTMAWVLGPAANLPLALLSTFAWIFAWTCVAQSLAWWAELLRATPAGTWSLRALGLVSFAAAAALTVTGSVITLLQASPTIGFVTAALAALDGGDTGLWARGLLVTLLGGAAALVAGARLLAAARRSSNRTQVRVESQQHARRPVAVSDFRACLRIDRAGVWRSTPMRRGLVALVVTPAAAAALAGLDWGFVVLLPGLVASGAGLLFGVNAFALDGGGALWRATLPGSPRTVLAARGVVVLEVCLAAAVLAAVASSLRAPSTLAPDQAVVVACAVLAGAIQVVSRCIRWSVERPYAAALREARDQPAPPAVMAAYSLRFALATTTTGLCFSVLLRFGSAAAAVMLLMVIVLLASRRVIAALRRWDDPTVRLGVLATVASARA